jgi:hypothetical protein
MKPIEFEYSNRIFAKDQPEYLPLPAHVTTDGVVTSCWRLTLGERIKVLFTGRIFWSTMTFNQPLQPQLPSLDFKPNEE